MQYVTLEDTVYFYFGLNTTAGAGNDGDTAGTGTGVGEPAYDVREGGASQSGAPTYSGWPILLTHANYPDGCYEIAVPATAANGFAANKTYGVFVTALISAVNPTGFVGSFRTEPVPSNTKQVGGTNQTPGDIVGLIGTPANFGSGNSLAQNLIDMVFQESGTGSGTGYDRASESLEGLAARLGAILSTLGSILNTQGTPQTGDSYAVVNDATIGNANLKILIDILTALAGAISTKIGNPINLGSGNTLAYNLLDMVFQEAGSGTGTGYDRTTESLEALAARIGALQQSLGVAQTGDSYALLNDPTFGNNALRTLLDALALLITDIRTKVGNPVNLGSGNSLASNLLDMTYAEPGSGTGTGYDRTEESLEALRARLDSVLSTVLSNLGTPQTGDAYGIVSNATYGNSAIRVVLDAIALLIGTPANFGSGNSLSQNLIDMAFNEAGTGSGTGYNRQSESLEGLSDQLALVRHIVSADMEVNTATTPWTVVYYIPGTSTVLFRKKLRDTVGADLTSEATIVGSQKEN